ncbi:MAG: DUF3592 domain-containing protein [Candidatus Zixiibacteriota bacterium]
MTIWLIIGACLLAGIGAGLFFRRWIDISRRTVFIVGSSLFIAGGIFVSVHGWETLSWHLAKLSWPAVGAAITDVKIVGDRAFHPEVSYKYIINDSMYTGIAEIDVPGFGGKRKRMDVAEKEASDFGVGDTIYIRYAPSDPTTGYIPEHLTKPILQVGFGLSLVLTGAFFIPVLIRK